MTEKLVTTPGIVLRRDRHDEDDLRLVLLTRTVGKIWVLVKGGRRMQFKLKAIAHPFVLADYQIFLPPHRAHGRLIGGRLIQSQVELHSRLAAFEYACRLAEVVEALLPGRAPAPEVFDLTLRSLPRLAHSADPRMEWIDFGIDLLKILGHGDLRIKMGKCLKPMDINRSLDFLQAELALHLPRPLKSDLFHLSS